MRRSGSFRSPARGADAPRCCRRSAAIGEQYALQSYKREIMIVDGERAAVMSDVSFVQRATDRTLRFRVANFLRLQDGRIIEFREFMNTFDVVEQALGRELLL